MAVSTFFTIYCIYQRAIEAIRLYVKDSKRYAALCVTLVLPVGPRKMV